MALPITILGSHTCEDTAITRDRLRALDIPFVERDMEDDADVAVLLDRYNHGSPHTPTLVFGSDRLVLIEPAIEELENALSTAGYTYSVPKGVQLGPLFSDHLAPDFALPSTVGDDRALWQLRGSRRTVLFFVHDAACLICQGFGRQLAARRRVFEEAEARLLFVLPAGLKQAQAWLEHLDLDVETLADAGHAVNHKYAEYFRPAIDVRPGDAMLLILDRFAAPRAISAARDAGGLMSPHEVGEWLHLLECECSE